MEQNFTENQIKNNQIEQKIKIIGKWTILIPLIQLMCVILVYLGLFMCGFPGDSELSTCYIGGGLSLFAIWLDVLLPLFIFLLIIIKNDKKYHTLAYAFITLVIGLLIPLFVLKIPFSNPISSYIIKQKEIKEEQKLYDMGFGERKMREKSIEGQKIENFSMIIDKVTDVTSSSATLNVSIINSVDKNMGPSGAVYFIYGLSENDLSFSTVPSGGVSTGVYSWPIFNLKNNTKYYYKLVIDFNYFKTSPKKLLSDMGTFITLK